MRFEAVFLGLALLASPTLAQDAAGAAASAPVLDADGTLDVKALPATGKPRQCVPLRDVQQTRSVGSDVILFRTGVNQWYRNDLRTPCPGIRDDRTLVFRTPSGSACALDTVDIIDAVTRIEHGFCGLGQFTPVDLPKGAKLGR